MFNMIKKYEKEKFKEYFLNFENETKSVIEKLENLYKTRLFVSQYEFINDNGFKLSGNSDIKWEKIPSDLIIYYPGYDTQYWAGWISFKGCDFWVERFEYDGLEYWVLRQKPSLNDKILAPNFQPKLP